ncbi:YoaK family protein [Paenibacillus sp. UNC451MF]|uniref:YoaK family protein n=1 Tax=Paenibacillus sp. UNC451MF TaxID=1449063 RepID=UPI000562496F|nr:YoaK family protein [Paenibacillus sp. UNC451MF]
MSIPTYRHIIILLLCMSSGIVDVVGYISLGHVFTANMTGNIVLMGLAIGHVEGLAVLRSITALLGFVAGTAIAALIVNRDKLPSVWPASVTIALTIEAVILIIFAVSSSWFKGSETMVYFLIALLSLAMGMQTTAARRLGIAGISTTVLTNNLANVIEDGIHQLRLLIRRETKNTLSRDSLLRLLAVVIYCLGAIIGTLAEVSYPLAIVWVPIAVLGGIIVAAGIRFRNDSAVYK